MQGVTPSRSRFSTPKSVATPGSVPVDPNFDYNLCTQVCQWPGDAATPRVSMAGEPDEAIVELVSATHGRFPLYKGNTVVGRDPSAASDDCNVLKVESNSMSRSHAMFEIAKHGSVWEVCFQDKGSLNGCRIGTRPLQINRFYEIKHGQVIHLGLEKFTLEVLEQFRPPSIKTPAKSPFARSISPGLDSGERSSERSDGALDGQHLQEGDLPEEADQFEMPSTQCYIDAPQQENLPNFGNANMMATQQYGCVEPETEMPATQAYAMPETLPQNVLQPAQNSANTLQSMNMMYNSMTNPMVNMSVPNTMTNTMPLDQLGSMPATQAYAPIPGAMPATQAYQEVEMPCTQQFGLMQPVQQAETELEDPPTDLANRDQEGVMPTQTEIINVGRPSGVTVARHSVGSAATEVDAAPVDATLQQETMIQQENTLQQEEVQQSETIQDTVLQNTFAEMPATQCFQPAAPEAAALHSSPAAAAAPSKLYTEATPASLHMDSSASEVTPTQDCNAPAADQTNVINNNENEKEVPRPDSISPLMLATMAPPAASPSVNTPNISAMPMATPATDPNKVPVVTQDSAGSEPPACPEMYLRPDMDKNQLWLISGLTLIGQSNRQDDVKPVEAPANVEEMTHDEIWKTAHMVNLDVLEKLYHKLDPNNFAEKVKKERLSISLANAGRPQTPHQGAGSVQGGSASRASHADQGVDDGAETEVDEELVRKSMSNERSVDQNQVEAQANAGEGATEGKATESNSKKGKPKSKSKATKKKAAVDSQAWKPTGKPLFSGSQPPAYAVSPMATQDDPFAQFADKPNPRRSSEMSQAIQQQLDDELAADADASPLMPTKSDNASKGKNKNEDEEFISPWGKSRVLPNGTKKTQERKKKEEEEKKAAAAKKKKKDEEDKKKEEEKKKKLKSVAKTAGKKSEDKKKSKPKAKAEPKKVAKAKPKAKASAASKGKAKAKAKSKAGSGQGRRSSAPPPAQSQKRKRDSVASAASAKPAKQARRASDSQVSMSQSAKSNKKAVFLLTSCQLSDAEKKDFVKKFPCKFVDSLDASVTHLVSDKVARTLKFLGAVCQGLPIVHSGYLKACAEAGSVIDYPKYALKDKDGEKKFGMKLQDVISKAKNKSLLAGCSVYAFASAKKMSKNELRDLVVAAGGTICPRLPVAPAKKKATHHNGLLCLGGPADAKKNPEYNIYGEQILIEGCLLQNLKYASHLVKP